MSIAVTCEHCAVQLKVKDEAAGLRARCPKCKGIIQIPLAEQSSSAAVDVGWGMPPQPVLEAEEISGNPEETEEEILEFDELGEVEERLPCPVCGELLRPRARFCRYCDEEFDRPLASGGQRRSSGPRQRSREDRPGEGTASEHPRGSRETGTVVTCDCGAAVRVPAERLGRQFACPQCNRGIALTVTGERLPVLVRQPDEPTLLCQICQTQVQGGEAYVSCPACEQIHHSECWAEVGGCGTYGCQQAPILDKTEQPLRRPASAWGDQKSCPVCRKSIKAVALRCRYCKTDFETADPLTPKEFRAQRRREEQLTQLQVITGAVFVLSLLGCTAPVALLVTLAYLLPRISQVQQAGPFFGILLYASIGISGLFSLLLMIAITSRFF